MKPSYRVEFLSLVNEVETKLKEVIENSVLMGLFSTKIDFLAEQIIKDFESKMPLGFQYKDEIINGLRIFKTKMYLDYKQKITSDFFRNKMLLEQLTSKKIRTPAEMIGVFLENFNEDDLKYIKDVGENDTSMSQKGSMSIVNYYQKVRQATDELANQTIKENVVEKAMSIRSMVEIGLRDDYHKNELKTFKEKDVKFVWVSTHADCSERCEPWQGRLYSLDGTEGFKDGHKFIPIERAVNNISYTKKTKKAYKNGLFGFNCRHRMIEYTQGSTYPMDYSHQEMVKEREVSSKQREMEREIFKLRLQAKLMRKVSPKKATEINKNATKLFKDYVDYSHKNSHAAYPERASISQKLSKTIVSQTTY